MDVEKRNAIRQILSGQDKLPVLLTTDDMGAEHDGEVVHHIPGEIDTPQPRRYNRNSQGREMEHTHEDMTDYKSMAAFFQHRLGEEKKAHELDLFFLQQQVAQLTARVAELEQEQETDVSEERTAVSATDE